jgi:FtsH-binding integral membrane protein
MMKKTAWVLSLALLLVTGVDGIYNGLTEWGDAHTRMQQSVTIGVFLYGVLGVITAFGLFRRRRWSLGTAICWGIAVTYVPGVAVMAYGGQDATVSSAFLASGASALIAAAVTWTAHRTTRNDAEIASLPR